MSGRMVRLEKTKTELRAEVVRLTRRLADARAELRARDARDASEKAAIGQLVERTRKAETARGGGVDPNATLAILRELLELLANRL